MKETLHIKNFGPIKEVKLELGKVNVLIGENGVGKTSIGKILCICRYFSFITKINEGGMQAAFRDFGLEESIELNTEIHYFNPDYDLSIIGMEYSYNDNDQDGNEFENHFWDLDVQLNGKSQRFINLLNELNEMKGKESNLYNSFIWQPPVSFFLNNVRSVMDNPFFLSPERVLQSIFSLGKSSLQNIDEFSYNQFSKLDGILRKFKDVTEIEPLNISYKNENGQGKFKLKDKEKYFQMDNAPSGFKTITPIVLISKYYTELLKRNKTVIIDEPEISLFPIGQKNLVYFLVNRTVNFYNSNTKENFNNQLLLTTHSPYILTSLNNLMYAYTVGQKHKENVSKIIPEKYWLNPADVSAYMLVYDEKEGGCVERNILDEKEGLIDAEYIDGVSSIINEEFDKLINIEIGVENESN